MPYSPECLEVLKLLRDHKNVLLSGPPACGKTRLLSEVAEAFTSGFVSPTAPPIPVTDESAEVPIPAEISTSGGSMSIPELPSPSRANRRVVSTVFSATTKPKDFLTALVPTVEGAGNSGFRFRVAVGKLVTANQHAMLPDGAALLIIDELNRGPAVQLFGGALVALEKDKRTEEDNTPGKKSWHFDVLNEATGVEEKMYVSAHLYVLASMNQADVSIEPLDAAFIRRWQPYHLGPRADVLRTRLGAAGESAALPASPAAASEVVEAAVRAWAFVNSQLSIGRGHDFQLGHGVFFKVDLSTVPAPAALEATLDAAVIWWAAIEAHVNEVLFGDPFGLAAVMRADATGDLYRLEQAHFGQDQRPVLRRPSTIDKSNIYRILRHVGG